MDLHHRPKTQPGLSSAEIRTFCGAVRQGEILVSFHHSTWKIRLHNLRTATATLGEIVHYLDNLPEIIPAAGTNCAVRPRDPETEPDATGDQNIPNRVNLINYAIAVIVLTTNHGPSAVDRAQAMSEAITQTPQGAVQQAWTPDIRKPPPRYYGNH